MTTATTPLKIAIENSRDYMKGNKRYSAVCVLLSHIDSLGEEALNKTLALYEVCGQLEAIRSDGIYGPSSDLLKEQQFQLLGHSNTLFYSHNPPTISDYRSAYMQALEEVENG